MKLLKILKLPLGKNRKINKSRQAARAVVVNKKNCLALLHVAKDHYHKLPGGGIEQKENIATALKRECLEEVGCKIKIIGEVGRVIEYRYGFSQRQESFCLLVQVAGETTKPRFTKREKAKNFKVKWVKISQAINLLKKDLPLTYEGKCIQLREQIFLQEAKKLLA